MRAWITTDPIDTGAVLASVGSDDDGATVLFLGVVRRTNDDRPVTGMRYDAYREMAERVLLTIVSEAAGRAGTERLSAVHRIGDLTVGETSVAIAVSTPHREQAFDAARYVIEQIKERLPVWKEEHYVDGDARWLEGALPPAVEVSRE